MISEKSTEVVFGCVAENTPKYLSKALRLVRSLRWFGGTLSNAEFIVCLVGGVDSSYQAEFDRGKGVSPAY
jgi:hypothetical protein